jgi:hypothetical protein
MNWASAAGGDWPACQAASASKGWKFCVSRAIWIAAGLGDGSPLT